ncbi:MAG: hypothetical protein F6J97_10515, partial [Leptolyngbya sp. SIO4C1]|nr:hypothetical protein [Leptolyngbya sp. SIO4C1]
MRRAQINYARPGSLPEQIMALWTIFLLGTLWHTQLALIPLSHHLSLTELQPDAALQISTVVGFMLVFLSLPMIAMIAAAFSTSRGFRTVHLGLTLAYSLFNLLHLVLDIRMAVPAEQLILMGCLFLIGLLLNGVAYR